MEAKETDYPTQGRQEKQVVIQHELLPPKSQVYRIVQTKAIPFPTSLNMPTFQMPNCLPGSGWPDEQP